jgi:hypothetical protein
MSSAASTAAHPASPAQPTPVPDPHQQLIQMLAGFWVGRCLQVAASLRVGDYVPDDASRSVDELGAATGAHAPSLYRLLRGLAGVGVFAEESAGRFRHTPTSRLLRTGVPGSLRGFFESVLGQGHLRAWCDLEHAVRTGETAFDHAHGGRDVWTYFAAHEDEQRTFDQAMTDLSGAFNPAVVKAYDFSTIDTLIDVGGGHGALLASILKAHPKLRGVVFDQPHVADGARRTFAEQSLNNRTSVAGGSFFETIPAGADACLMKFILHDWDDARCAQILRNVHAALPPGGKLLVVELVLKPGNEPDLGKLMDLNMLAMTGGKERTEAEFAKLFADSNFDLVKVHPTECPLSIVEAVRR